MPPHFSAFIARFKGGVRHEDNKLLAAIPANNIAAPRMFNQEFCNDLQNHIAAFVPIHVVELFEIIHIHDHNSNVAMVTFCTSNFFIKEFQEIATVKSIRQGIVDRLLLQFVTKFIDLIQLFDERLIRIFQIIFEPLMFSNIMCHDDAPVQLVKLIIDQGYIDFQNARWVARNLNLLLRFIGGQEKIDELGPGAEHFQWIMPDDLIHGFAKRFLRLRVCIQDPIMGIDHKDHFRDMLQDRMTGNRNQVKELQTEDTHAEQEGSDCK